MEYLQSVTCTWSDKAPVTIRMMNWWNSLTCNNYCGKDCNWTMPAKLQNLDQVRRKSEQLHQSIPIEQDREVKLFYNIIALFYRMIIRTTSWSSWRKKVLRWVVKVKGPQTNHSFLIDQDPWRWLRLLDSYIEFSGYSP